ncbi:hypothetical protein [Parasitella parasitica]|uniref:rRNA-processing protein n=1 Tax=Parasitella parasitica TaxID=35722 RepID=A0A0B7MYG8_9FUNG|nr:hypothetical protein [Parasitella parasitica]
MVAVTKNGSKADIGGVVDTINKRVSGEFYIFVSLRRNHSMVSAGKNWKVQKTATGRNQQPKQLRKSWDQRSKERARNNATKTIERQLKADKQAAKDAKRAVSLERKKLREEQERMQALAAKMSAKRLERLKKREMRKKARV